MDKKLEKIIKGIGGLEKLVREIKIEKSKNKPTEPKDNSPQRRK
jgi:hypothetical protein